MFSLILVGGLESDDLLQDIGAEVTTLPSESEVMEFLKGAEIENAQLNDQELSWLEEGVTTATDGQEEAATRIQAAFRGYKVRKEQHSSN